MGGKRWETKCPIVYSDSSFEDNFKKAVKQSEHIIYDLRQLSKKDEAKYLNKLKRAKSTRLLKTLLVIKSDGELLTEKGRFDIIKP